MTAPAYYRPEPVPRPLPLSVNLLRDANGGTLTAGAAIVDRGRTTIVVDVGVVSDEHDRLLARRTATPRAPGSAVPANR